MAEKETLAPRTYAHTEGISALIPLFYATVCVSVSNSWMLSGLNRREKTDTGDHTHSYYRETTAEQSRALRTHTHTETSPVLQLIWNYFMSYYKRVSVRKSYALHNIRK